MDEFELELKQDFLEESDDLLQSAEETFLRLEDDGADPELLNEIFRLAHNLKGTSQAVGFEQLSELTHVAESLILKLKEGEISVTEPIVNILLTFKDKVTEMIEGLKDDFDARFDISNEIENLQACIDGKVGVTPEVLTNVVEESTQIETLPSYDEFEDETPNSSQPDDSAQQNNNFNSAAVESLRELGFTEEQIQKELNPTPKSKEESVANAAAIESLRELGFTDEEIEVQLGTTEVNVEVNSAAMESLRELGFSEEEIQAQLNNDEDKVETDNIIELSQTQTKNEEKKTIVEKEDLKPKKKPSKVSAKEDDSIRVKLSRIDQLNNIIGELVIMQTVLSQRRYEHIRDDISNDSISQMSKLFKEVQELSMSLRMIPMKNTFQKMNRIVRDTSKALGKEIKLHLVGEDTEVDKTVLEHLTDPLVHMVRNSVDHGIESSVEKRVMNGKTEFGNVELMAFHEGSNLVIQITDDGGGIDPEVIRRKAIEKGIITEARVMSEMEKLMLIFNPGFSTKEEVSEVSGRGVGMDVVKSNIEKLGGEIKMMSKVGEGSSFKIILPLTLAIVDGIVVSSENDKFVIPLSQVNELTQVNRKEIEKFSGGTELFRLRGEVLPLFYMKSKINQKVSHSDNEIIIVVKTANYTFGVAVEDIIRQQQIVIKQIGEDIKDKKGIIGAAILGDGKPVFILDLFELFESGLKESRGYRRLMEQQAA